MLKQFDPTGSQSGKTDSATDQTHKLNGKGKGGTAPRLASDVGLLNALQRLVTRAEKKPEGLLGRLRNLIAAAENAARTGQSINPTSKKSKVSN